MYPGNGGRGQRRCAVCGESHATCGPTTTSMPVDGWFVDTKEAPVGELRTYKTKVNGMETTVQLTEEDAEKLYPDATLVEGESTAKARATSNKARPGTENK
jgi:hypothetical protein